MKKGKDVVMPWWGWLLVVGGAIISFILYACLKVASDADDQMEAYYQKLEQEKKPTIES